MGSRAKRVVALYGGMGYEPQRRALRRGADIVVACPGRLEDLIERRDLNLSEVHTVVLDEADRMVDMGFIRPPVGRSTRLSTSARSCCSPQPLARRWR